MKRIVFALVGVGALAGAIATTAPVSGQSDGEAAPIYGIKLPRGYRELALDLSQATDRGRGTEAVARSVGQRYCDNGLSGRDAPVPGRRHHCRAALERSLVRRGQQSLSQRISWRRPRIFLCRDRHERSIHGQGLEKVRRVRRLGICRLHKRQTRQRGAARKVLSMPPACKRSRLRFHSLRTYALN
jgi:hypothetical protein